MKAMIERALMVLLVVVGVGPRALAQNAAPGVRVALVIGIGGYPTGQLPTAANDAGLVAQTLAAAGFEATAARDLDGDAMHRVFREFLDKARSIGPDGIAFIYFAGRALQFEGENYLVPMGARIDNDADLPIETLRLSDMLRAFAALPIAAKVFVVDGAYGPGNAEARYPDGLALAAPGPGGLLAFNAAPGTIAEISAPPYGTYARVLTQTMKQGGVPVEEVFARVRVAVNAASKGTVAPWEASRLKHTFMFFERAPDAPAMGSAQIPFASLQKRPLRDFSPEQAYDVALARDSLQAYQEYLTVFPEVPLARRVRIMVAARREAMFWHEALGKNSRAALWTYLKRYPKGPHAAEAQRRLGPLAAKMPPMGFAPLAFDVPPPAEFEYPFVERRFRFDDPELAMPPPPPLFLLPPAEDVVIVSPPANPEPGFLPIPDMVPIPFVRPVITQGRIVPPRGSRGVYSAGRRPVVVPGSSGRAPQPTPEQMPAPEPTGEQPVPVSPSRRARGEPPADQRRHLRPPPAPEQLPAAEPVKVQPTATPGPARAQANAPVKDRPRLPPQPAAAEKPVAMPKQNVHQTPGIRPDQIEAPARRPPAPSGESLGSAQPKGGLRSRAPNAVSPALVRPDQGVVRPRIAPPGEAPRIQVQPQGAVGGHAPQSAPRPTMAQPRSVEPRAQPQQRFAPPPVVEGQPRPGAFGNRNGRPECGHPGQPQCRP